VETPASASGSARRAVTRPALVEVSPRLPRDSLRVAAWWKRNMVLTGPVKR
jgi:hypothetical protein